MALPQVITLTSTLLIDSLTTFCAFFLFTGNFPIQGEKLESALRVKEAGAGLHKGSWSPQYLRCCKNSVSPEFFNS